MLDVNEVLKILASPIISAGVAIYAIFVGFKRFNAEKWREKEFQYYVDAIEVINDILRICDELIKSANNELVLSETQKRSLHSEFNSKKTKLGCFVNVGKLVFSADANEILMNYDNNLYGVDISKGDLRLIASIRDDGEGVLNELIRVARSDLNHKSIFSRM